MRWTAVINPAAGRRSGPRRSERIVAALRRVDVEPYVSADPDDAVRAARAAFALGRGVAVCGGDGTVAALAGIAAEERGPLAVVATGSGNDFARGLELPRRLDAAVALIHGGRLAAVDLARSRADDGATAWTTTVANMGFDAEANRWANGVQGIRGTPLYVAAAMRTLLRYRPVRLRVTVDGAVVADRDAWLAAVCNTRCYGGGLVIAPAARVDDGVLDVCLVGATSRGEFVRTFPRVFRGTHVTHRAVETYQGRSVRLELPDGDADLWSSGERVGPVPATVECVPGALTLVVPVDSMLPAADPPAVTGR